MSSGVSARHGSDPGQIGRFRIDGRLGSGAMGVVYSAYDELMGRQVALKVLIDDLESDPETRARFYREALAAARVIHPNVITIFDAGEDRGRSFIAMQLLQGAPLAEYLSAADASLERKVDLMIQVCEGLSAAHAQQVVHRDLKPSNLFVQTGGLLKILDFGVARLADSSMTAAGTMLGTPDYMSPEQAQGRPVSATSDIFSAGAVFYFMLAGSKPFKGANLRAVMRQLISEQPDGLPPTVPPELAAIVLTAMIKDPASRPGRIEDVLSSLLRFRRQYAATTRRLVTEARALRASVLDLVNDVVQASTPLGPLALPEAAQALHALQALESRFAPLTAAEGALDVQPSERHVVDEVVSGLSAHRDALVAARDARHTPPAHVEPARLTPHPDHEARERRLASRVDAARLAIEAKDWSLAVRECQQALSLMPAHHEASALLTEARAGQLAEQRRVAVVMGGHLDRASAAIEARALDAAAAALDDADALQAGWPETAALRRQLLEARALAEADAELQRLMADEIRHARSAFRRGRTDEAVQELRTFIEMEPRAEVLAAELTRLEQLRQALASGAAAARKAAADPLRRATQLGEMGVLDDAVAAARQALEADPTNEVAASLLDRLLVRCFDARVKREEERLAQERVECVRPALDAARRALDAGYVEFASRAAAAAGCIAPSSEDVRALADETAAQMRGEDPEIVDLGPTPYGGGAPGAPAPRVSPPAAGAANEPPRFDRAIGMLKNVFSKSAPPASPRPQDRR